MRIERKIDLISEANSIFERYSFTLKLFITPKTTGKDALEIARLDEPFVFINEYDSTLGIAHVNDLNDIHYDAIINYKFYSFSTYLEKTVLYYMKRLEWYERASAETLRGKYGAIGARRGDMPRNMVSKIKAEIIPSPIEPKKIKETSYLHTRPFDTLDGVSYDAIDFKRIAKLVRQSEPNLKKYAKKSEVPHQLEPDYVSVYLNKDVIEYFTGGKLNVKTGWYPLEDVYHDFKDKIKELDLEGSRTLNWDKPNKAHYVGIDCEYVSQNSKLLTFQIYNATLGVGFMFHYNQGEPKFKEMLAQLHHQFDFEKIHLVSHYNIAEISHFKDFSEDLSDIIAAQKELLAYEKQEIKKTNGFYDEIRKGVKGTKKKTKSNGRDKAYRLNDCSNFFRTNGNSVISVKPIDVFLKKDGIASLRDENRYKKNIVLFELTLKDSYLVNNKEPLANLGAMIGFNKDDLTQDEITRMDELLINNPKRYYQYSFKDAIITALATLHTEDYLETNEIVKDSRAIVASASTTAGKFAQEYLDEYGKDIGIKHYSKYVQGYLPYTDKLREDPHFAKILRNDLKTDENSAEFQASKDLQYKAARGDWFLPSYIQKGRCAYYGGRNECFAHGIFNTATIDVDLKSAYPSAMMSLYTPDWHNFKRYQGTDKNLDKIIRKLPLNAIGYIKINSYKLKSNILYPNLPAKLNNSLIFVRSQSDGAFDLISFLYCYLNDMFVNLDIEELYYFPPLNDFKDSSQTLNIFGDMISELLKKRAACEEVEDKIGAKIYKNISNFIYGKTCQGIGNGSTFNISMFINQKKSQNEGNHNLNSRVPPSAIYNPVYAASVTGLIRTMVTETMERLSRKGIYCASVTTDGFVAMTTEDNFRLITDDLGMFNKMCLDARHKYLGDDSKLYDIKHRSYENESYVSIATRFYFNMSQRDDDDVQVAGAGIQIPKARRSKQGEFLMGKYAKPGETVIMKHLASVNKVLAQDSIFNARTREVLKNYDYDMKRKPVDVEKTELVFGDDNVEKVRFLTKPFESIKEYQEHKKAYKNYNGKRKNNKIQTKEDVEQLEIIATLPKNSFYYNVKLKEKTIEGTLARALSYMIYENVKKNKSKYKLLEELGFKPDGSKYSNGIKKIKDDTTDIVTYLIEGHDYAKSFKKTKSYEYFIANDKRVISKYDLKYLCDRLPRVKAFIEKILALNIKTIDVQKIFNTLTSSRKNRILRT